MGWKVTSVRVNDPMGYSAVSVTLEVYAEKHTIDNFLYLFTSHPPEDVNRQTT